MKANQETEIKGTSLTTTQWTILILFFFAGFIQSVIIAVLGPLYPPEAESKGLQPYQYGLVNGVPAFLAIIFAPIFGIYVDRLGVRPVFLFCTLLNSVVPVVIGLADFTNDLVVYYILSVGIRIFKGILNVGIVCSKFTICFVMFPGRISTAIGVFENGFLLGTCVGPFIGTTLFSFFGFPWTFITIGLIQLIIAIGLIVFLPRITSDEYNLHGFHLTFSEALSGYLKIFRQPSMWTFIIGMLLSEMTINWINTILEPGLRKFNLSEHILGFMFLSKGLLQLLAPIWGIVLDKVNVPLFILSAGFIIVATGVGILSPLSFIPSTPQFALLGLVIYGLGQGILDISSIACFQLEFKREELHMGINLSVITIIYLMASGVGSFSGASISGALLEEYGFIRAMYILVATHLIYGIYLLVLSLWRSSKESKKMSAGGLAGRYEISPLMSLTEDDDTEDLILYS